MREKIIEKIHQTEKVLVLTHFRPDGDTIASAIAMYHLFVN